MAVTINTEKLLEALQKFGNVEKFEAIIDRLQELKYNPFKLDEEGSPEGWADAVEGATLFNELLLETIRAIESVSSDVAETVTRKEKLDAVVGFLDDVIDAPWYLEAFDGPAIKAGVVGLVSLLNSWFGPDWINHIPKK